MAVLQLVKEDPRGDNYNRRGVYKAHMLVAVYEDSEIKEPASPTSRLYFLRVPGTKADYLEYLEDSADLELFLGMGRKKYTFDIDKLKKSERDDIRNKGDAKTSDSKDELKKKFKRTTPEKRIFVV